MYDRGRVELVLSLLAGGRRPGARRGLLRPAQAGVPLRRRLDRRVPGGDFMGELDAWMRWFRSGRISRVLGWFTPDEHRFALGYAV